MDWEAVLSPLVEVSVAVLVALLVSLRPVIVDAITVWVAARAESLSEGQQYTVATLVREAVRVSERLGNTGVEKQAMAAAYLTRALAEAGIEVSQERVADLIEAAVSELRLDQSRVGE